MNLDNDVVYRRFRLGPLHQRHPGRSRSLIRHHNRLHQAPPCIQSSPLHHEACPAFASVVSLARRASISYCWPDQASAGAGSWLTPVCERLVLTAENLITGSLAG
jgi:hypothetical protein